MNDQTKTRRLGLIGTVLGLVALGVAVFHFFFGPIEPPPPIENVVAETTIKLKEAITLKLQGREYEAPVQGKALGPDKMVEYSVIILGFVAIVLGVIGFVQREEWRPSGMALVLGSGAIAFQFAVVVVGALLAVILIGFILSTLNIG